MPVLYHQSLVGTSAAAHILLAEKDIAYEYKRVDPLADPAQDDHFLTSQDMWELPLFVDDDGVKVSDAGALLEFIDERYPLKPFMPRYPKGRWQARIWLQMMNQDLASATTILAWSEWGRLHRDAGKIDILARDLAPGTGHERRRFWVEALKGFDKARLQAAKQKAVDAVQAIEDQLGRTRWLAGSTYSIADICVWPFAKELPRLLPSHASVAQASLMHEWIDRIATRDAVITAMSGADNSEWMPGAEPIRWG